MRLLSYSSYFYPYLSGMTTYQLRVLSFLAKDYEVTVLTFPYKKGLKGKETVDGLLIIRMPYLLRLSKGFLSLQSLWIFFRESRQTDIVIINVPNFEALFLVLIAKLLKKKVVAIFYCEVDLGKDVVSRTLQFFLNTSIFIQLMLSDVIVGIPDYIEQLAVGKRFKNKVVTVMPPIEKLPVDDDYLSELQSKKNKAIWVGFIGRVSREKGVQYLVEAASELLKTIQNIVLVFVGPAGSNVSGEEDYFKKINHLLNEKKVPHIFYGIQSDEKLGAIIKSLDVVVLPSVNQTEAFGMVQAESMLLGTPIIATNLPGVRAPIRLTGMGLLVHPKDSHGLADAIKEVVTEKNHFSNQTTQKKAQDIFSAEKTYAFFRSLFSKFPKKSL